ncbi:MAG TPA: choice-of-anchor tandem repeat GloVer-containing protein [Vicinamibacterales bacterium]|nr:choice-of-anchor tandem repeat GloVer-containing protein [Vicinamibacterales bacterium]
MRNVVTVLVIVAHLGLAEAALAQEDYTILKVLGVGAEGLGRPLTSVLEAGDGNLYGGLDEGGIFRFTRDGRFSLIADVRPFFDLIQGSDGFLYGSDQSQIFRIALTGEVTVLAALENSALDGLITGSLVEGNDGNLYGIARSGWIGVMPARVFKVTPQGAVVTVFEFDFANGDGSSFTMIKGRDGAFYGTTPAGGSQRHGTIFRLDADGSYATIHSFGGVAGSVPQSPLVEREDGTFFGTTVEGGLNHGTIFRFKPGVEFSIVHQFQEASTGARSPLTIGSDGDLYGSTDQTIYRVNPMGGFTLLHRNNGEFAARRWGQRFTRIVEWHDGNFYGTAQFGGPSNGVLFRLNRQRTACANDLTLTFQGVGERPVLYINHMLKSETAALGGSFFVSQYGVQPFWFNSIPPITPAVVGEVQFEPFPPIGTVGVYSFILTPDFRICADWETVYTGGAVMSDSDLRAKLTSYLQR